MTMTTKKGEGVNSNKLLPYATLSDFDYTIDFDFNIQGSYIASVLNLVQGLIKKALNSALKNTMKDKIKKDSIKMIDMMTRKIPIYFPIPRTSLAVDMSLLADPYVEDGKIVVNTRGLGIGDWGLGIGDWGLGPIPNPQSPIPNPQSPIPKR